MTGEWSYRLRDLVAGSLLFLLAVPIMVVVAVVLLVADGRPVLFRQERPGRSGRPFILVKFRTIRPAKDLVVQDAERVSRVGRVLRSTSLDELPELWNVVRGDMSLVGPRPLLDEYLAHYSGVQHLRHQVRPGLTGLTQVSGRNALDWQEKLDLDVTYVRHRTHRLDLIILLRTALTVLGRRGVNHPGHVTMPRLDARPD
jgi:lipopolysaccharide/colanic/teichoic acid biosynthesis glycosyltransferase